MEIADRLLRTEGTPDLNFQMACDAPFHMVSSYNTSVFDNFFFSASFSGLQGNLIKITFSAISSLFPPCKKQIYTNCLQSLLSKNSFTRLYFANSVTPTTYTSRYRIQYFSLEIRLHAYADKEGANLVKDKEYICVKQAFRSISGSMKIHIKFKRQSTTRKSYLLALQETFFLLYPNFTPKITSEVTK